ncbi:MAG: ArsA family ATPase [Sandaracinaceae bacterium]
MARPIGPRYLPTVPAPEPLAYRLSLFTGKGGVGKSTLVAALALEAARRGMRPLVVELGHRASMAAILGRPSVDYEPTEVAPGVHAANIDLERALADYVQKHVPVAPLARRIAASRSLQRFFYAAPAVSEVLTLDRLETLLAEGGEERPRFHPVLLDFDATGHALMFLTLPQVFEGLVPSGPLRRLLDAFSTLLTDRERTRLHLVTLPGRLPVQETLELHERLAAHHPDVPLGTVFLNRCPAPSLPAPLHPVLDAVLAARDRCPPDVREDLALLSAACRADTRRRAQIARLDALPLPRRTLPDLGPGPLGLDDLAALGLAAGGSP